MRMACLQLITKEMPDVKKSYWYAYENNLVVVHPSTEELAHKVREYILNPKGSDVVPPEYLSQLRKEMKEQRRAEAEAKEKAQKAEKEAVKAAKAQAAKEATQAQTPPAEAPAPEPAAEDAGEKD